MRLGNRPSSRPGRWFEDEVLWGVGRREGHSDTDDPRAHASATQHAFEFGHDEQAVCGYEPPKRMSLASTKPRPQLALASVSNPRCPKCESVLLRRPRDHAVPVAADPMGAHRLVVAEPEPAPRVPGWGPRYWSPTESAQSDPRGGAAVAGDRRG